MSDGVSASEKYAELEARGEERPRCECHGEVMYWHANVRKRAGGHWRCVIKKRERSRRYHQNNLEKNRERNRESKRRWRQNNPEKNRERNRLYRQNNLEKNRERNRLYRGTWKGVATYRRRSEKKALERLKEKADATHLQGQ